MFDKINIRLKQGVDLMQKKLRRSSSNKIIAGVCGGIADYFNIDASIVRVVWILLSLANNSPGLLAYIICALIIPQDDGIIYQNSDRSENSTFDNTPVLIGIVLVIFGAYLLLKIIFPHLFSFNLSKYWPILLIIAGIYIIITQRNK